MTTPIPTLYSPDLYLLAEELNAIEGLRIATENRLRQATRAVEDKDGEVRGAGLPADSPGVVQTTHVLDGLNKIEKAVVKDLERQMRRHPLGAWQRATTGVGEKQLARLLACIGDPYWNTLHDRPRTVSELWAYCGLHTLPVSSQRTSDTHDPTAGDGTNLPAGHWPNDTQRSTTSGDAAHHPGRSEVDPQDSNAWVAARRHKGQRANWSAEAKSRLRMIAESMLKAGNRETYDKRRVVTANRVHASPCVQCGEKKNPAEIWTPWRLGHQHSDALRMVAKYDILRELWRAARDAR